MAEADTSTRTIAAVGAVIAILAFALTVVDSARTGLVAQYAGTAKEVSEENDKAILTHVDTLNQRVDALQKELAEVRTLAHAPPPAPEPTEEAAEEVAEAGP